MPGVIHDQVSSAKVALEFVIMNPDFLGCSIFRIME